MEFVKWNWSKNGHFSNFFFQAIQTRKMTFTIFQTERKPFQAIKNRSSNRRKLDIFPKGLTYGFGPKMVIFPTFFSQDRPRKISFTIFQNEKTPFQAKKTRSSRSRKIKIQPMILVQKWPFFHLFVLANKSQENVFYDILKR